MRESEPMTLDSKIPATIVWHNDQLKILDQRRLPGAVSYLEVTDLDAAWQAINTLAVRGAPAIGITAAYALVVAMHDRPDQRSVAQFLEDLNAAGTYLKTARPTAVNLAWAVDRVIAAASCEPSYVRIKSEAETIHAEDRRICRAIGEAGRGLISPHCRILTHCNAGSLAVSELGTATAPLYLNHAANVPFKVYVGETRPLLQGARLTAWELSQAGIDVTLICDSMAASLMAAGQIDLVIVGTDRVTGNGDVVNKIGTLNLAVLCHHFEVPFYVACPVSSYDPATPSGAEVVIEERDSSEILGDQAADVPVFNPAFDITPAALVSGIITDRGIARAPLADSLAELFQSGEG
jgi:methylthioribose-1-phosphate isomerase